MMCHSCRRRIVRLKLAEGVPIRGQAKKRQHMVARIGAAEAAGRLQKDGEGTEVVSVGNEL